jgi:hypothetical protein
MKTLRGSGPASGFADMNYQHDVWVRHSRAGVEGSYTEAYNQLFGDFMVYDVLSHHAEMKFDADQASKLQYLADKIREFDKRHPNLSDKEIIELPEWNGVIERAKDFLESIK